MALNSDDTSYRPRACSATRAAPPLNTAELLARAKALQGHSVQALAEALGVALPPCSRRAKGFVGQLVEHALGSDVDAGERPDFVGLGVELKTVPVNPALQPQESTFVCSIRLSDAADAHWQHARLRQKLQHVLVVPVLGARLAPLGERYFFAPVLFRLSPAHEAQLRADWEDLMGAIGAGRGHSLGAQEGCVLQVRPKAANRRVRNVGPTEDGVGDMLPLGFYLRPTFMAQILAQTHAAGTP